MRPFNRRQLVSELSAAYPEVYRLALLLTGRHDTARSVSRFILSRAVPAWPTWDTPEAQQAWFFHHTLLAVRRTLPASPPRKNKIRDDLLLPDNKPSAEDVEWLAFVTALRTLPFQQLEAFILFEVLGFDLRRSSVAMDMSTTATAQHLAAARTTLQTLTADRYPPLLERIKSTAFAYQPDDSPAIPTLNSAIRRHRLPRLLKTLAALLFLLALAYAAYKIYSTFEI